MPLLYNLYGGWASLTGHKTWREALSRHGARGHRARMVTTL